MPMDMSKYVGDTFRKVDDIKANGSVRVTIIDITEGRFGKPDLTFDDGTKLSVNKTNARILTRAYGTDGDEWVNKRIELVVGTIPDREGRPQESILVEPISKSTVTKARPEPDDDMNDDITF